MRTSLFVLLPCQISIRLRLDRKSFEGLGRRTWRNSEICDIPFIDSDYRSINMDSEYVIENNVRITAQNMPNSGASKCICYRPHSNIICNGCGFWTKGRVRYCCPQHPKIVFLYDYAQCPRCKSYDFMLTEI